MTEPRRPAAGDSPPVVVLFGGPSAEHDVSIVSGTAIAAALRERGHPVAGLMDLDGGGGGCRRTTIATAAAAGLRRAGRARRGRPLRSGARSTRSPRADPQPVVFIALHGPFGEDGTVQALLEAAGLRLHRARASRPPRSAWTRRCSSGCAAGSGLPVVDWREVRAARWARDRDAVLGRARGLRRRAPAIRA